jgi:redox-sensing transcriptional repressor
VGDIGHARSPQWLPIVAPYQYGFDNDPQKISQKVGNEIYDTAVSLRKLQYKIKIMLTVPSNHAQETADMLVKAGIKAILNYAPISLNVPPGVRVQHIDPATHLQRMTYYLD